jgi:hypothetical protein
MVLMVVSENTAVMKDLRDRGVDCNFIRTICNRPKIFKKALMISMS